MKTRENAIKKNVPLILLSSIVAEPYFQYKSGWNELITEWMNEWMNEYPLLKNDQNKSSKSCRVYQKKYIIILIYPLFIYIYIW